MVRSLGIVWLMLTRAEENSAYRRVILEGKRKINQPTSIASPHADHLPPFLLAVPILQSRAGPHPAPGLNGQAGPASPITVGMAPTQTQ